MARKRIPKEEYDKLYYYVNERVVRYWILGKGESPLRYTSPRRYDTLEDAVKAAMAKSKRLCRENRVLYDCGLPAHCTTLWIYKGEENVGVVHGIE